MQLINNVLNFLFPQTCGICDKISEDIICNLCRNRLKNIILPNRKCYLNLNGIYYDEHMHIFKYNGIIKEKIIQYKFCNKAYLYKLFSEIILSNKKVMIYLKKYDCIMPVPLHKYRNRSRGYNQTYLILKELNKRDNSINIKTNILQKEKNIKPQSSLNKFQRKDNIKNAYIIRNNIEIKEKKILLFDDVFTTGSTTNECSRILKQKGVQKVGVLTIAKD